MRIISRIAALGFMASMPGIAVALAEATLSLWRSMEGAWFVDDAVALAASAVGTAVAAYLSLTGYAMLFGALARGGRGIPASVARWAPGSWRRLAAFALGVGMTSGLAGPALAADAWAGAAELPGPIAGAVPSAVTALAGGTKAGPGWLGIAPAAASEHVVTADATESSSLAGAGWVAPPVAAHLDAPTPLPTRHAAPAASASFARAQTYVVQPGDSLWRIAESLLGDEATDGAIAATWPQLYEANESAIGADPSLIQPGLELTVPGALTS